MAELRLNHISKAYSEPGKRNAATRAVDDISFTVKDNEFMVMVGPSGCGKSTILRMIAGLEDITEGDLLLDGKRINALSPKDRDIAMVFQNYALYPHMTVYDNMAFGLKLKHYSKSEIKERVMQTAELLEIEEMLQRKPKMLSGGQRQRVAIGRAIIRRPKVFLFDEPLSNLDAKLRTQMRIELQKLHRSINVTMIYVTHDQTEAMTLGDRIAVLNKGKLMQMDTPLKLYNTPVNKFVAGFIGSPAMNFIQGTLKNKNGFYFIPDTNNEHIFLGDTVDPALAAYIDQPLQIGIRPEHVYVLEDSNTGGATHCKASIMAYENMGNEQLVYFTTAENSIIVRRPPVEAVELGKIKRLNFQTDKITWFDGKTDRVIEMHLAKTAIHQG